MKGLVFHATRPLLHWKHDLFSKLLFTCGVEASRRSFQRHDASCRKSRPLLFSSALPVLTLRPGTMGTPVKNSQIFSRFSSETRPFKILGALWPLCESNTPAFFHGTFCRTELSRSVGALMSKCAATSEELSIASKTCLTRTPQRRPGCFSSFSCDHHFFLFHPFLAKTTMLENGLCLFSWKG